jgi:hypothetical protein
MLCRRCGVRYSLFGVWCMLYGMRCTRSMMGASLAWLSVVTPHSFVLTAVTCHPIQCLPLPLPLPIPYPSPPTHQGNHTRFLLLTTTHSLTHSFYSPLSTLHCIPCPSIPHLSSNPTHSSPHLHAFPFSNHSPTISLHHRLQSFPLIPCRTPGNPKPLAGLPLPF